MIGARKILAYALFPQVMPRLRELFAAGFSHIAFFMAQIYRTTRLLPADHPYLNPSHIGRFGIRHVVAQAAANLRFKKDRIDQIVIFFVILAGLVLLAFQFGMLALAMFVQAAHALPMPTNFAQFFVTPPPGTHDLAYVMLDRVFGIPDMFNSCVAQNVPCFQFAGPDGENLNPHAISEGPFPWPYHLALRSMWQLYSIGLLVIALIIFLYFVVTVVMETAESGTPFGRRFNHVWAPLRMVAALGLLIPLPTGLNSGQYITLYAAKWGSGFATNSWNMFLSWAITASDTLAGNKENLIASPDTPEITTLLEYATVLQTCTWAEQSRNKHMICGWLVRDGQDAPPRRLFSQTTYADALKFYNNQDVLIRFGEYREEQPRPANPDPPAVQPPATDAVDQVCTGGDQGGGLPIYTQETGNVLPYCGEVVVQTTVVNPDPGGPQYGAYYIQEQYYELMKGLWMGQYYGGPLACGAGWAATEIKTWWGINIARRYALDVKSPAGIRDGDPTVPIPTMTNVEYVVNAYKDCVKQIIDQGVEIQIANAPFWDLGVMQQLGWGGAAIWYNKIAQINGVIIGASQNLPYVRKYPKVMEDVRHSLHDINQDMVGRNQFRPYQADGKTVILELKADKPIAVALWHAFNLWTDAYVKPTNNAFLDAIQAVFGLEGLFALTKAENINVHPLALLVGIGKSLIEAAIRNLGFSLFTGVAGGLAMIGQQHQAGGIIMAASSFMSSIAMVGLSAGFILFYVLPFLPFVYFFFAVATWIKGLFEAMVGVPLWALAHIRIDGEGLPGQAAMSGYYMLLEIFLRPILIVFGLLASILIFSAQVRVLHEIWPLVVSNLAGFDRPNAAGALTPDATGGIENMRDIVDSFFYTVIYAVVVYMAGMSSFKLVDLIPGNIMRWMGANVQAFSDFSEDPAENLVRNLSVGAGMFGQAVGKSFETGQKVIGGGAMAIGKGIGLK